MNKPAPNEPSMDEILSSIRQIIADDDAGPALRLESESVGPELSTTVGASAPEPEPVALTRGQIVRDGEPASDEDFAEAESDEEVKRLLGNSDDPSPLVDPEDVSFDEDEEMPVVPPMPAPAEPARPRPTPGGAAASSRPAALPDPQLTSDMAEELLLGPAAQSAVKSTLGRLNNLSMVGSGVTLEELIRQMLRPMLKEWLDENLPAVVERMVEREIERVSRGGR